MRLDIFALVRWVAVILLAVHLGWSWWLLVLVASFVTIEVDTLP